MEKKEPGNDDLLKIETGRRNQLSGIGLKCKGRKLPDKDEADGCIGE